MRTLILLIAAGILSGCVTAGDRKLNDINRQAGAMIEQSAEAETIRLAGADIRKNSESMAIGMGAPDEPVEYTPAAALAAREQSGDEHDGALIEKLKHVLPGWIVAFISMLCAAWQAVSKILMNKKTKAIIEALIVGIQSARASVKKIVGNSDGKINWDEIDGVIKSALKTEQAAREVWPVINAVISALKKNGEVKEVNT